MKVVKSVGERIPICSKDINPTIILGVPKFTWMMYSVVWPLHSLIFKDILLPIQRPILNVWLWSLQHSSKIMNLDILPIWPQPIFLIVELRKKPKTCLSHLWAGIITTWSCWGRRMERNKPWRGCCKAVSFLILIFQFYNLQWLDRHMHSSFSLWSQKY